jgi:L-alanine-DL-glutamate epimerase-like enolase superfamily enzyme
MASNAAMKAAPSVKNTTATASSDYIAKSGTLTFNPGTTNQTITVVVNGDTLVEADESCYSPSDVMQIIRHEAADVLNIKLNKAGGLYHAKKIAALAESAGLKCVLGTSWGLGVEIAAKLHLDSSTMLVTDAVEFTEIGLHGNLLTPPHDKTLALPVENGCLPVPEGPGLGIAIDDRAVAPQESRSPQFLRRSHAGGKACSIPR